MERGKKKFKFKKPRSLVHCTVHHLLTGTIIRIRKFLGSANVSTREKAELASGVETAEAAFSHDKAKLLMITS